MLDKLQDVLDSVVEGLAAHVSSKIPDSKFDHLTRRQHFSWYDLLSVIEGLDVQPYVEILSGKYKGSIGYLQYKTIRLGSDYKNTCPLPTAKNLRLLPDYEGPPVMKVRAREIRDIFDQTIAPGDKVIFADRGKLRIGVLVEYRFHDNRALVKTPEGTEEVNPRKSQIVNCQKINESFIANTVLTATLKRI